MIINDNNNYRIVNVLQTFVLLQQKLKCDIKGELSLMVVHTCGFQKQVWRHH